MRERAPYREIPPKAPDRSAKVLHPLHFQRDDKMLIQGIRDGHPGAFRAFYGRHVSFVYSVLLRTLGSEDELDSLVYEVFFEAFRWINKIRDNEKIKSWIAAIAVNTARDTIKRRKRNRWLRFFDPAELPEIAKDSRDILDSDALNAVYDVLGRLNIDQRIAFTLRFMNEMKLEEIADACGVSIATVKRRLAKAKRRFYSLAKHHPALEEWMEDE